MDNLKMHSYQPAPLATSSSLASQKGGGGYGHKKRCKCPLCKRRRGGGNIEEDIETGPIPVDKEPVKNEFNFAADNDYDDLDAAEKGESGSFKVGGSRRRKRSKKSKKGSKGRKTRRHRRKSHRRR